MAKRLKSTKSKNAESFYIIDDFTDPKTHKRSTFVYERLGSLSSLMEKYNTDSRDEVYKLLKERVDTLRKEDMEDKASVSISFFPSKLIPKDNERVFNIGYLYIKNILTSLGIKGICNEISSQHSYKYDLFDILCDLVCTRIIYPGSKRSSFQDAHRFLDTPKYELEDIYRSLPVFDEERYFIEKELYLNSEKLFKRDTSVLYYDCTNFYFEIEEEDDYRLYGKSKENRPNPIVQYGLFMDSNGIPLADIPFEGNRNEQFSLRELEQKIENDFEFSRFVVCADAGLNGWDNKIYNDRKNQGAYIVTQSIKKLNGKLKDWVLKKDGWQLLGHSQKFNIDELGETITIDKKEYKVKDLVFYKERWIKTTKSTSKYELEEHLIVTYSTKYKEYQNHIREKKIERARKLIKNPGKINKTNNQRDPRYYISSLSQTDTGEVADKTEYSINEEKILQEAQFDGFYAVTTDLEDEDLSLIIQANKQRWEIEESFEIMKSELKTRPVYVQRKEAINGHLLTCFISLLVYRILEKEYLKEEYTCREIIDTLRELNITHIGGNNYIPSFKRTELVDKLAETFGFQPSKEILTQKYLKKFTRIVNSKKSTKLNSTSKQA